MNKIYGIIFKDSEKEQYYKSSEEYMIDDLVVVGTESGEFLGKVKRICTSDYDYVGTIIRKSTEEDYNNYLKNLKDSKEALEKCKKLANDLSLNMKIINAEYNLNRSQLTFNFTADNRVDFRELAKKLASFYHIRIELRQIGARDKAKEISGVGICGGELCCSRFLKTINSVNMNMAKNQNLALNPNKINGSCGRLLCCLQYEDELYTEAIKELPKIGDIIKTEKGDAEVIGHDILNKKLKIIINGEKEYYDFK